jgi:Zn-dependent peptidase ImmA (M78 family)
MMLARQATLKKTRNLKKTAAKLIEDEWLSYQNRKKLKDVRKYLWTLPYECRILYFKFQQVKKDADNLKNDVDQLIAKKQGKLST